MSSSLKTPSELFHEWPVQTARPLELLGEIEELLLIYPKRSGEAQPHMVTCLSDREPEQQLLFDKLDLGRYKRV